MFLSPASSSSSMKEKHYKDEKSKYYITMGLALFLRTASARSTTGVRESTFTFVEPARAHAALRLAPDRRLRLRVLFIRFETTSNVHE
ncbi:hypothetical protein EVAR_99810_1 [Eumeta japonica]|uniref:Uncharacterized protein n=1 Tax=Eumeta variegata TaxID=151549 RepID=A0A4C1ZD03_EUMVA|nr:hypothetical protein EVAR_99810_1 [Eumeta japonica]